MCDVTYQNTFPIRYIRIRVLSRHVGLFTLSLPAMLAPPCGVCEHCSSEPRCSCPFGAAFSSCWCKLTSGSYFSFHEENHCSVAGAPLCRSTTLVSEPSPELALFLHISFPFIRVALSACVSIKPHAHWGPVAVRRRRQMPRSWSYGWL